MFNHTADGKGKPYVHEKNINTPVIGPEFEILSKKSMDYYEKMKAKGENVYIDKLKYEEFMLLGEIELSKRFSNIEEKHIKEQHNYESANELEYMQEFSMEGEDFGDEEANNIHPEKGSLMEFEDTISNRVLHFDYSDRQKAALHKALDAKIPKNAIMEFFYPEVSAEKMDSIIEQ